MKTFIPSFATSLFKRSTKIRLYDLMSGVLLFGSFITDPVIQKEITHSLLDLKERGYLIPTQDSPVRIYPLSTSQFVSSHHGGTWKPGVISIRESHPDRETFIRHELMHEMMHRTCKNSLPLWGEEASAIAFSGEARPTNSTTRSDLGLMTLREQIRTGAKLSPMSYETLKSFVSEYSWPTSPCSISPEISQQLGEGSSTSDNHSYSQSPFSYVLSSALSGRVLESSGDIQAALPPGSLMKIPYAAALKENDDLEIGKELARSDTEALLKRRDNLQLEVFDTLISQLSSHTSSQVATNPELLGYRNPSGSFPYQGTLQQLALTIRASLFYHPEPIRSLSLNGDLPFSTLEKTSSEHRKLLKDLGALAKTGTVSNERGDPLLGYLMVAWPKFDPRYIAIFRQGGIRGSSLLSSASPTLSLWKDQYLPTDSVRVQLLTPLSPSDFHIEAPCPILPARSSSEKISLCGTFEIEAHAKEALAFRSIQGQVDFQAPHPILLTDPETYTDGVLIKEADTLTGEARKALRAVIFWNGLYGQGRHQKKHSLCDTTHCMVFQGSPIKSPLSKKAEKTDRALLKQLSQYATQSSDPWFQFSKGSSTPWTRIFLDSQMTRILNAPIIVDIQRERLRTGEVSLHLIYAQEEEHIPCEVFRKRLSLPGCPDSIAHRQGQWVIRGSQEGNSIGYDVGKAQALSDSGKNASEIIKFFLKPETTNESL